MPMRDQSCPTLQMYSTSGLGSRFPAGAHASVRSALPRTGVTAALSHCRPSATAWRLCFPYLVLLRAGQVPLRLPWPTNEFSPALNRVHHSARQSTARLARHTYHADDVSHLV
uniref:Uncharacterized protein n=1 Tax=Mycetohabitans sp. TaxID=2571162 RepID=A0A6B9HFM0_9BURK|nr:hypothetical protein [Mycetohabitans sp.]